ncbi:MAG: pyridoxal phosphate-dependent aminotransferase [Hyphomicrobiales bacterium]
MTDFSKLLSRRAREIEEPAIIRMSRAARELQDQGKDIVGLTIGEPDFDTPEHIQKAGAQAIADGYTHYSPMPGMPELRAAVAEKLRTENGLDYGANEVVITNGAKQALTNAIFALIDRGDEAILVAPYWAAYAATVDTADGVNIVLPTMAENDFKISPDELETAITPKTKLFLLNSPCNPSGAVYSRPELEALADVVRRHPRITVISDEIYEYITFGAEHVSFASLEGMRERVITVNGFSKGYAMTGWRLGYLAAPGPLATACAKMQGMFTAGANQFVQIAGVEAIEDDRSATFEMTRSYEQRRDFVVEKLSATPELKVSAPEGTFYIFPDVSAYFGKSAGNHRVNTSEELCMWLLNEHGLAVVPGESFGDEKCLRISFAASQEDLEEGLARLTKAFAQLS